jgi:Fe-S-cluster formation regulator IscX/YfhJ
LFVDNTPTSEAARGIVSVLDAFGLDTRAADLKEARAFFNTQNLREHVDRVFDLAHVSGVVMTNDPFDEAADQLWTSDIDRRFKPALRLDRLLSNSDVDPKTVRVFLDDWIQRRSPVYMALSLPAAFKFPADDAHDRLLREVILPTAQQHRLALTLMIGVRRGVNPSLREAGDGLGKADVAAVERLCAEYPEVKFLVTFLSRENQHELCVAARKFSNLMPFGCWWFLNNPSIVSEITRERFELLGQSFIPQHSDARVLEQLIYKWKHARREIGAALYDAYEQLLNSGRAVTTEEISRDVNRLFSGNFNEWIRAENE